MKVIGFKVEDKVYEAIKTKLGNKSFKSMFEKYAIKEAYEKAVNNGVNHVNSEETYIDAEGIIISLVNIHKAIEKVIKEITGE